jgi:hypothetical protein
MECAPRLAQTIQAISSTLGTVLVLACLLRCAWRKPSFGLAGE